MKLPFPTDGAREIIVSPEELNVGDVIIGCSLGAAFTPWPTIEILSKKPTLPSGSYEIKGYAHDQYREVTAILDQIFYYKALRFGKDVMPPVNGAHSRPKVIDEFPHVCTRCGRRAYLGLFEVSHKDEKAAKDCPARRK